ncbi:MAG: phage terminase small subunit P27 family [Pseudomonadales bacterium]
MGLRGPIPMPTSVRKLRGNKSRRPTNPNEPQPRRKAPVCPPHLDAEAKKEWKRLCRLLLKMDVLTEADGMALACLCQTWSTLRKAQAKLNETGMLFKTPSGYVQQNPLVGIVAACMDTVTKLGQEFGLTPAARGRLQVAEAGAAKAPSVWAEFVEKYG